MAKTFATQVRHGWKWVRERFQGKKVDATAIVSGTLALSLTLAIYWPLSAGRGNLDEPKKCGSLNRGVHLTSPWTEIREFEVDRTLVKSSMKIGTYYIKYQEMNVPVIDGMPTIEARGVDHYEIRSAEEIFPGADKKWLTKVRQIQQFLRKNNSGIWRNAQTRRAVDIAIYAVLDKLSYPGDLSDSIAKDSAWRDAIDYYIKAINEERVANPFVFAPVELDASLSELQYPGFVSVETGLYGASHDPIAGENITATSVVSTAQGKTGSEGTSIIHLRSGAPGKTQQVVLSWAGAIPAGTLLAAIDPAGSPSQQGHYVFTTAPASASLFIKLTLPEGQCA